MKLARRDYFILPLLALATTLALLFLAEISARIFFPEGGLDSCHVPDGSLSWRAIPNCATTMKRVETPWFQLKFNSCGYRTEAPCGPKPPGTVRVALMGSSVSEGLYVPYQDIFAVRASHALTQITRRNVDFQNMGVAGCDLLCSYHRLDEAVRLNPDIVLLTLSPFDLEHGFDEQRIANRDHPVPGEAFPKPVVMPREHGVVGLAKTIAAYLVESRATAVARHLVYQDPQTYLRLFLAHKEEASFLRQPLTPEWDKRLADLEVLLSAMQDKLQAKGIPFAIVFTPQRAEAILLTMKTPPPGENAWQLQDRIGQIASRHGIIDIDTCQAFSRAAHPEQLYYPVDGHLNSAGQGLVAKVVTQALLAMNLPAFHSDYVRLAAGS